MSGFATARRFAAAAASVAALSAAAGAEPTAPARELALDEIRALAAIATAGRAHADPRCRSLAASAGDLGAAAVDALVHVDKSRALLAVGEQALAPAGEDDYRRVAATAHDARDAVIRRAAACPELLPTPR